MRFNPIKIVNVFVIILFVGIIILATKGDAGFLVLQTLFNLKKEVELTRTTTTWSISNASVKALGGKASPQNNVYSSRNLNNGLPHDNPYTKNTDIPGSYVDSNGNEIEFYDCEIPYTLTIKDIGGYVLPAYEYETYDPPSYKDDADGTSGGVYTYSTGKLLWKTHANEGTAGPTYIKRAITNSNGAMTKYNDTELAFEGCNTMLIPLAVALYFFPAVEVDTGSLNFGFSSIGTVDGNPMLLDIIRKNGENSVKIIHCVAVDAKAISHTICDPNDRGNDTKTAHGGVFNSDKNEVKPHGSWGSPMYELAPLNYPQYSHISQSHHNCSFLEYMSLAAENKYKELFDEEGEEILYFRMYKTALQDDGGIKAKPQFKDLITQLELSSLVSNSGYSNLTVDEMIANENITAFDYANCNQNRANVLGVAYSIASSTNPAVGYSQNDDGYGDLPGRQGYPRITTYEAMMNALNGQNPGADCSSFVHICYDSIGLEAPGNTYSYASSSHVTQIDFSEAKPGDIFYRGGHVTIFVAWVDSSQTRFYSIAAHEVKDNIEDDVSFSQESKSRYTKCYRIVGVDSS